MRIGDIELRKLAGKNNTIDIVKWERIGTSDKESCYSIAFINDGIPSFVGSRAIDMEDEDEYRAFLWLLRKAIGKSSRWKEKEL